MKILIVAVFFPPQNSIASLRPYSWAKWWSRAGHEVTVLTTEKEAVENDLDFDCSYFEVKSLAIPFFSKKTNKINNGFSHGINQNKIKDTIRILLKNLLKDFSKKTGCFSSTKFPDICDLWVINAKKMISKNDYDVVVSTGGPYSVHRIGYFLKKKNKSIKWVIDWRDHWVESVEMKGFFLFRPYEKYLETKFHNNSNLITTVSDPFADVYRNKTKTRVATIYNGFDKDDYSIILQSERKKNDRFTIVHTGTIWQKIRDPSPLLKAISNLKVRKEISPKDIHIIFMGNNGDISQAVDYYNVHDFYSYYGFCTRNVALQLQYDADAVLFLGKESEKAKGVLTGKLFEYLYISRMIWAIGITNKMQAGEIIEKAGAGFCFGTNISLIEEKILECIRTTGNNQIHKDMSFIDTFDRKKQAEKMLDMIQ